MCSCKYSNLIRPEGIPSSALSAETIAYSHNLLQAKCCVRENHFGWKKFALREKWEPFFQSSVGEACLTITTATHCVQMITLRAGILGPRENGRQNVGKVERQPWLCLSYFYVPIFASRVARADLGKQGKLGDQEI